MTLKFEIQLNDLINAINIIDVAAKRGAFDGSELSQVGGVRDKIYNYVALFQEKSETPTTETDTTTKVEG